jgi:hypothetical protein
MGQELIFAANGVAPVTLAADVEKAQHQLGQIFEVPHPGVHYVEAAAGNATTTITVPSGKYWVLHGAGHQLITDANVANRAVVFTTQDTADAEIEAITHANVAASTTAKRSTLWGTDDYLVGNEGVAAQGTLSMATIPTAADTMTLDDQVFTFVAALTATGQILLGANVAATQAAMNAAFVDRDNGGVLHTVTDAMYTAIEMTAIDFAANDMVFTAAVKGTAGNSLATTETFTPGGNVFDAATLGTTTAGVDQADKISTLDYPASGVVLDPGEDLVVTVTNGVAGDTLDFWVMYSEYDSNPTT